MDLNKLALITGGGSAALFILAAVLKLLKRSKGLKTQPSAEETDDSSELTGS